MSYLSDLSRKSRSSLSLKSSLSASPKSNSSSLILGNIFVIALETAILRGSTLALLSASASPIFSLHFSNKNFCILLLLSLSTLLSLSLSSSSSSSLSSLGEGSPLLDGGKPGRSSLSSSSSTALLFKLNFLNLFNAFSILRSLILGAFFNNSN